MSSTRTASNRMLIIGLAVLMVGVVLVLLILRNGIGSPSATLTAAEQQDPAVVEGEDAEVQTVATQTPEDLAQGRLPLPFEVPEGTEALAVRAGFVRGVAGLPQPGDHVNLYRYPQAAAADEEDERAPAGNQLPPAGPDGELALAQVEVLGLVGPLPTQNDGEITVLLAVESADVPGLLPLARDGELWLTLLPSVED